MRRALLILIPFFAAITAIIGGFYAWVGVRAMVSGNAAGGALFLLFGLGGFVLAASLWSLRRRL